MPFYKEGLFKLCFERREYFAKWVRCGRQATQGENVPKEKM